MDAYVKAGEIELWRGVRGQSSATDFVEAYRSGQHYSGGLGGAQYGSGTYTAYGKDSGFDGISFAKRYAKSTRGSALMRMTLKPDARIAEYNELQAEKRRESDPALQNLDAGQYAIYKGYDAVRVANQYQTRAGGHTANDWKQGFVVVLNRSAVRVSSKTYVPPSEVARAPAGADPPPRTYSQARHVMKATSAKHAGGVDYKVKAA
jgi:hypothetical protein